MSLEHLKQFLIKVDRKLGFALFYPAEKVIDKIEEKPKRKVKRVKQVEKAKTVSKEKVGRVKEVFTKIDKKVGYPLLEKGMKYAKELKETIEKKEERKPTFVEKLKPTLNHIDKKLDSLLTKGVQISGGITEKKPGRAKPIRETLRGLDVIGDKITGKFKKAPKIGYFEAVTKKPKLTLFVMTVIVLLIGSQALHLIGSIEGDIEVYLPPGDPSTETLNEIREDWPTDLIIIYVTVGKNDDITDLPVLEEMSRVEEALDYNKTDYGENDSISYILSISSIIKEINNATGGNYSIPDKEKTDLILSQLAGSEELERLIKDTDGDGTNDSAVIMMGMPRNANQTEVLDRTEDAVKNTAICSMTVTGQPAIMKAVQERTFMEFMKVVPLMFIFTAIVLFFFHRTLKLVVIALLPMLYAILVTFGFLGMVKDYVVIAPQIILVAPLLFAFGIGDALYISNRFAEEKTENIRKRTISSVKFVQKAIFLTSITTALGFASLMIGTLKPLFTIGFALAIGIMACWIISVTLVPCLIILLKYKKRYELKSWKGFGKVPINNRKKILAVTLIFLIISLGVCLPNIRTSADYYLMAPQDEPSVIKMQEYSQRFDAGQPGMMLVRADITSYNTLATIEYIEEMISKTAPHTKTLSIVGVMKMMKVNTTVATELLLGIIEEYNITLPDFISEINITNVVIQYVTEEVMVESYWDLVVKAGAIPIIGGPELQSALIEEFYNRLSVEMRSIFINRDRTKTIVLIDMPVMPVDETKATLTKVDKVIDDYGTISGGSTTHLTGMAAILVAVNDLTIENQFVTMLAALIMCFIVLALLFKSIKFAAVTIIPVCFVVMYEPLAFVGANVELSLITMMIASIIIGVGIDYSIHLTHGIMHRGLRLSSVSKSVESSGISFLEATTTEVAALSAALIIPIASVRAFIIMIIIMLIISMLAALIILPAIYAIWIKEKRGVVVE
ncbi:MAG: MMPL family transporter [Thermoplasmatales archaeon]|nr:MMPL family transporter [Thermoplasmatales archaeon]